VHRLLVLLIFWLLTGCGSINLAETSLSSGQTYGHSGHDYQAIPIRTQLLAETHHIDNFRILVGPELVTDIICKPSPGYLAGVSSIVKFSYRLEDFTFFSECGAGPTYLSVQTHEQGNPGFNFIDQLGGGVEYRFTERLSLGVKYRYSHVSHAGLRDAPNHGIDAHSGFVSFKFDF